MTIHTITTPWSWIFCLESVCTCAELNKTYASIVPSQIYELKMTSTIALLCNCFLTLWLFILSPYLLLNKPVKSSSDTVSPNFSSVEFLYSSRPVAILVNAHGRSPYLRLLQLFNYFLEKDTCNSVKAPSTVKSRRGKLSHRFLWDTSPFLIPGKSPG